MKKVLLPAVAGMIFACSFFSIVFADVATDVSSSAANCVKGKFIGDASTYNPYQPGWRSGGSSLATGGSYDPNSWSAALQLDLARQIGCGYGNGHICTASVETPAGRSAIVLINDNGPLVPGRVIDLNQKSMDYLSGGNASAGVIKNVTVTVLCTVDTAFLGPLDEASRQAFLTKTFGMPATPVGQSTVFNTGGLYNTGGLVNTGAQYNGMAPLMAANQFQQPFTQPAPLANQQPQYTPSYTPQQASVTYAPNTSPPITGAGASANIIVWPHTFSPGQTLMVYWTSVNMSKGTCQVIFQGQQFAQSNEGTKPLKTTSFDSGKLTFTLECSDGAGQLHQMSDSATLQ